MFFIIFLNGFLFGFWFVSGSGERVRIHTGCIGMAKLATDTELELHAKLHLLKTILGVETR